MAHFCKDCGQNCQLISSRLLTALDAYEVSYKQNQEYRKAVRSLQDDVRRLERLLAEERAKWKK